MLQKKLYFYVFLFTFVITSAFPLFFFKLGQSSLVSFDEAWYAAIARNIRVTKDPFNLYYNNGRFADHPPAGFWLISLSQSVFGDNEFGSRAASAILGVLCLGLVFILGAQINSPVIGLSAAIALASSPWFIYRARSGNLDVPLTFFFLLCFILAIKAAGNKLWLILLGLSLALLFLTKTMVPFTILPAVFILFLGSKLKLRDFIPALIAFILPFSYWLVSQLLNYPDFLSKYFTIGIPKTEKTTSIWQNILLTKTYLHEGIGDWFRPIVLISPFSLLIKNKIVFSLFVFVITFLTPFALSSRGQIWHLLPVHPILLLLILSGLYFLLTRFLTRRFSSSLLLVFTILLASPQMSRNWNNFIAIPAYISDEAILSKAASAYPQPLYIDDRFLPVAVYYSGKHVNDTPTPNFSEYFGKDTPILLITHSWRLESSDISKDRYQILKTDRDKLLLLILPKS